MSAYLPNVEMSYMDRIVKMTEHIHQIVGSISSELRGKMHLHSNYVIDTLLESPGLLTYDLSKDKDLITNMIRARHKEVYGNQQ